MPNPTAQPPADFPSLDSVVNQIEVEAAIETLRDASVASVRAAVQAAASIAVLTQITIISNDVIEKLALGMPDDFGADIVNACSAEGRRLMSALGLEPADPEVR